MLTVTVNYTVTGMNDISPTFVCGISPSRQPVLHPSTRAWSAAVEQQAQVTRATKQHHTLLHRVNIKPWMS